MGSTTSIKLNTKGLRAYTKKAERAYKQALDDVVDDLIRTSSESAPHRKGTLEQSWSKETKFSGVEPYAEVTYSVKESSESGNYNYALKMHEGGYKLGEKSKNKPGGVGMSGRSYPVGANFLGGVLKGEQAAYTDHINKAIKGITK